MQHETRARDTKGEIHRVALELFSGQGYEKTSLREIAEAVYGLEAVAREWANPDGVLRRRTRYLVKRGVELMDGAYQGLLKPLKTKV